MIPVRGMLLVAYLGYGFGGQRTWYQYVFSLGEGLIVDEYAIEKMFSEPGSKKYSGEVPGLPITVYSYGTS